jgi:hypothetical protein
MPRYVILEHDHPCLHWDLMLEEGEVLRTWRLAQPPRAGVAIAAVDIFRHRKFYLDYEGPVSGNRGHVRRWDSGTYLAILGTPIRMVLELSGKRLQGHAHLTHVLADQWEFQLDPIASQPH